MKRSFFIICCVALLFTFGCSTARQRFETIYTDLFDTATTVVIYADSRTEANRAQELIYSVLLDYHRLSDCYNEYDGINNITTVNKNAGAPVPVDEKLISLLEYSCQIYDMTDGAVNICLGSVLALWHDARQTSLLSPDAAYLPDRSSLEEAFSHSSANSLVIDRAAGTVTLTDPDMSLDLGAIAKGYAVEQAAVAADTAGYCVAINAGGNIRTTDLKGDPAHGKWQLGILSPTDRSTTATVISLGQDTAVATSGNYQRFFELDGVRYCHIIDPQTLMPAVRFSSVTVISADSALCDALSTALFILPLEDGEELLRSFDGAEALWITPQGEQIRSGGFANYEDKTR